MKNGPARIHTSSSHLVLGGTGSYGIWSGSMVTRFCFLSFNFAFIWPLASNGEVLKKQQKGTSKESAVGVRGERRQTVELSVLHAELGHTLLLVVKLSHPLLLFSQYALSCQNVVRIQVAGITQTRRETNQEMNRMSDE